jgi:hypothetical protein
MYSSATTSSSASGFSGGGLFVFEAFGEAEGEDAGEAEGDSDGVDFDFRDFVGFSEGEGEGEAFWSGFTGPVGLRGGAGFGVGVGEGDGAATAAVALPRQNSSAKMNGRDLMGAAARPP